MPKKLPATGKQVRGWFLHLIVFAVVNAILWYICYKGATGWVYPWPSWITAAWGLTVIGHACLVWGNYEDKGHEEWKRQASNG
jgi:hypothetical protein